MRSTHALSSLILGSALGALSLGLGGCVSSGKYDTLKKQYETCRGDLGTCGNERDSAKTRGTELEGQLATCDTKLASAEKLMADVQTNLAATKEELDELRRQREQNEKRLAAFRDLTAKFQKMIGSGKIKVKVRDGRMLVELPAGVLFASGKADLSKEGQAAIGEVAEILKQFPDRRFLVAGHTDSVPLRGSRFKSNWELSASRAVTVTEFLIGKGVNPKNLSAAGLGEFDPVAENTTDVGKQQNRRIEIVLQPNIEELPALPPDLLGGDKASSSGDKAPASGDKPSS